MGIRKFDLNVLDDILLKQNMVFKGLKMLQLGDQIYREKRIRAKKYFEDLGVIVVSIDINGRGGSLPIDLSKPIDYPEYKEHFDLVTNYGTSEHVSDDIACFENMYNCCRKNGIMLNLVPREGYWNRGVHINVHKYNIVFFADWAKSHSCEILVNRIVDKKERYCDDMVLAILKKI